MKILTLRARLPDAVPTPLHERVTVLAGLSEADRDALRSTFAAFTESSAPGLEAVLAVNGTTIPLDASFASTYELLDAPSCVVEVPAAHDDPRSGGQRPGHSNPAAVARLRAKREALRSELVIVERETGQERAAAREHSGQGSIEHAPTRFSTEVRELVDQLAEAIAAPGQPDRAGLANRLDELAMARVAATARSEALAQLRAECRVAIDSVKDALARGIPADAPETAVLVQLERLREEMIELAAGHTSRRARNQIAELRDREAELLASTGHSSYPELLAALQARSAEGADQHAAASARLALLHELESFWSQRSEEIVAQRAEEAELLARAEELLGESPGSVRDPRLAAVRLRSRRSPQQAAKTTAEVLAVRLAGELGYDSAGVLTPREVLELAEEEMAEVEQARTPEVPRLSPPSGSPGGGARLEQLEADQLRLRAELQQVEQRLEALSRAAAVAPGGAVDESDVNTAGDVRALRWSLAAELDARRPRPHVGVLPVLIVEPTGTPSELEGTEVPDVVAMSARRQLVWITDRPGVMDAMEMLGNLGSVIRA